MGEIVNLRLARKRKSRDDQAAAAAANRAIHGRTKAQKVAARSDRQRLETGLDGHRIERPGRKDTP